MMTMNHNDGIPVASVLARPPKNMILLLLLLVIIQALVTAASNDDRFPAIYTLHTTRKEWRQQLHPTNTDGNTAAWLHMDILEVKCDDKDNDHSDPHCRVQALVQTNEEYDLIASKMPLHLPPLRYNATLTREWVEPRLEIVREVERRKEQQAHGKQPRSLQNKYSTIAMRDCYLDVDGMVEWMQDYVKEAGEYMQVSLQDIGDSYLKTVGNAEGDDIVVLTVTGLNTNTTTAAPLVLMTAIHAREYTPPEVVRRFLLYLFEQVKANNTRFTSFLQHTQIHWIPYVNIDGRRVAETTQPWRRKNMNDDWNIESGRCSSDAWGVDLNRNYPFAFGKDDGSSDSACSPFARGPGPQSEPETKAMIDYANNVLFPPDNPLYTQQRTAALPIQTSNEYTGSVPDSWLGYNEKNTRGIFVDMHSYGEVYIFPWGYANSRTPNHNAIQSALGKLEHITGYEALGPGEDFYGEASGATDDSLYALFGPLSFTMEIGNAFHESCINFEQNVPKLIESLQYAASIASQPYVLGQGPDIVSVQITPGVVQESDSLNIMVKASDSEKQSFRSITTAQQFVTEIRVYMDDHPLVVGNERIAPVWSWNSSSSSLINGELDVTLPWNSVILARGAGNHIMYIQAIDSNGYHGPVTAVDLTVDASTFPASPVIESSAGNGTPTSGQTKHTALVAVAIASIATMLSWPLH
jgi:hypothetical protein